MKYDAVYCINLEKRPEKWEEFRAQYPVEIFGECQRYVAMDGVRLAKPDWWRGGNGAWGCFCSHRRIIEQTLNEGRESVLIFEDDAVFCGDFASRVMQFHDALPEDAAWIYYGGQHLAQKTRVPERVNDYVFRPYNVNRTHAYGLRGTAVMKAILQHLERQDWTTAHHIDHHFGRMHAVGAFPVYCPAYWLVDQRGGISDVAMRDKPETHWRDAATFDTSALGPLYLILGTHSSGSSCLAGMLWNLGMHLGNVFIGAHGKAPIYGGEAIWLHRTFTKAAPVPVVSWAEDYPSLLVRLQKFAKEKLVEGITLGKPAGLKYPQLAAIGADLLKLHSNVRIISIRRPILESVISLHMRFRGCSEESIREHQRWLDEGRSACIRAALPENVLELEYADLLAHPEDAVTALLNFIPELRPTSAQRTAAVEYPNCDLCHISMESEK
ncbi:MAG: glycosyltransferase family 25 protein [Planctomycetia bacterium]|nr:glycosyltransferase family 25 protein [Planctomycetia bacterium]